MITFRKKEDLDLHSAERLSMVETQIRRRGVKDERVLEALRKVPRHRFVPEDQRDQAYNDYPLPIGYGQTISQPYIVGLMTELLQLKPESRVLEIGTGSGYQAAILAELAREVYTIEIVEPLALSAGSLLESMGYANIKVRAGDGFFGWPENAPFDGIILTAAPEKVPQPLLDQLKEGGRLVIPEGKFYQDLVVYEKIDGGTRRREVIPVRFVPMTGRTKKK
ncbi:MAG: protein-L-isoaspartate O-methyltransferase [Candidatus Glassbacteria bacterium RIFCSPLOWO2_12_FULL_58_11]|uniref:Protein-L-isoaspartate O-methyltransferase n=2 Tax=Candidatus Glassiibacteriota TaxID=1817805 RepID=A0A1F5Z3M0_9BACT|nr:MAG: protein-L-isoaspartate O-methyltransferase [Candidatus Glassbacteria bacterium GWA2_58_10]OGG06963.1 MAG: protein-L-isoaspartate O-methyltransferase [Candidatus Glassbacteria bacterium RIFCSPLOWO2_12_FULL_58_11]